MLEGCRVFRRGDEIVLARRTTVSLFGDSASSGRNTGMLESVISNFLAFRTHRVSLAMGRRKGANTYPYPSYIISRSVLASQRSPVRNSSHVR